MLGIDIGTTNAKAALYSFLGQEILVKTTSYPSNSCSVLFFSYYCPL